jgi:hypothetical protein
MCHSRFEQPYKKTSLLAELLPLSVALLFFFCISILFYRLDMLVIDRKNGVGMETKYLENKVVVLVESFGAF